MSWPSDDLITTNVDAGTDSPAAARANIFALFSKVKAVLAARGVANGVASLDAAGKVPLGQVDLSSKATKIAGGSAGNLVSRDAGGDIADAGASVAGLTALINARAPLASPNLTGNPTAPTQGPGTNNSTIANTAFVAAALTELQAFQRAELIVFDNGVGAGKWNSLVTSEAVIDTGLGSDPDVVALLLECVVPQHGFSVGEILVFNNYGYQPEYEMTAILHGDGTITVRHWNPSGVIVDLPQSTGVQRSLIKNNWRLRLVALQGG